MKKSKIVNLVLITSLLASCAQKSEHKNQRQKKNVYMRGDSTARYSRGHGLFMWYYAFRPYGYYDNGAYHRAGYYSNSISRNSNIGSNVVKSNGFTSRGGFGSSSRSSGGSYRGGGIS
jgi:hypothetical protein